LLRKTADSGVDAVREDSEIRGVEGEARIT
jgi:hypothetical protein